MCCNTCLKSPADSDGLLELRNHRGGSNGRKRKGGKKRGREGGNVYGNPSFRSSQILLCSVRLQRKQNQDVWVNTCPTFSELDECVHLIDRPPHRTFQKYLEWSRRPKWPPTGTKKQQEAKWGPVLSSFTRLACTGKVWQPSCPTQLASQRQPLVSHWAGTLEMNISTARRVWRWQKHSRQRRARDTKQGECLELHSPSVPLLWCRQPNKSSASGRVVSSMLAYLLSWLSSKWLGKHIGGVEISL